MIVIIIIIQNRANKWYMNNPESVVVIEMHNFLRDFEIQTDRLITVRQTDLVIINQKVRTYRIADLAVLADDGVKLQENDNRDKYLDLARETKNMEDEDDSDTSCNWWVRNIAKGLLKGLEDLEISARVETIQTTAILRSARIPRRVLENWKDFQSLKLHWKTIS